MSGSADRPWWRDWRGMPPSFDHRAAEPLVAWRVRLVRVTWATLLVVGSYGAVQGWSWAIGWLVVLAFQVAVMPARNRRQVLGLPPRAT